MTVKANKNHQRSSPEFCAVICVSSAKSEIQVEHFLSKDSIWNILLAGWIPPKKVLNLILTLCSRNRLITVLIFRQRVEVSTSTPCISSLIRLTFFEINFYPALLITIAAYSKDIYDQPVV